MRYDAMICEECMVKHPVEAGDVEFNYCPICGSELYGYVNSGVKIETEDRDEAGDGDE